MTPQTVDLSFNYTMTNHMRENRASDELAKQLTNRAFDCPNIRTTVCPLKLAHSLTHHLYASFIIPNPFDIQPGALLVLCRVLPIHRSFEATRV